MKHRRNELKLIKMTTNNVALPLFLKEIPNLPCPLKGAKNNDFLVEMSKSNTGIFFF